MQGYLPTTASYIEKSKQLTKYNLRRIFTDSNDEKDINSLSTPQNVRKIGLTKKDTNPILISRRHGSTRGMIIFMITKENKTSLSL